MRSALNALSWTSNLRSLMSCPVALFFGTKPVLTSANSADLCFCVTAMGSCHNRASTSSLAITGTGFSAGVAGRVLTSGLYCAITPASTAMSGNSVAQGTSNFGLSLFAMVASACSAL